MARIEEAVASCEIFVAVGTSGTVFPAAGLASLAKRSGAHTVEINPAPSGGPFDTVIDAPAEVAVPRLVADWLQERL